MKTTITKEEGKVILTFEGNFHARNHTSEEIAAMLDDHSETRRIARMIRAGIIFERAIHEARLAFADANRFMETLRDLEYKKEGL